MARMSQEEQRARQRQQVWRQYEIDTDASLVDLTTICGSNPDARIILERWYSNCTVKLIWPEIEDEEEYERRIKALDKAIADKRKRDARKRAARRAAKEQEEAQERETYLRLRAKFEKP